LQITVSAGVHKPILASADGRVHSVPWTILCCMAVQRATASPAYTGALPRKLIPGERGVDKQVLAIIEPTAKYPRRLIDIGRDED
jgi:hypothetical protein